MCTTKIPPEEAVGSHKQSVFSVGRAPYTGHRLRYGRDMREEPYGALVRLSGSTTLSLEQLEADFVFVSFGEDDGAEIPMNLRS